MRQITLILLCCLLLSACSVAIAQPETLVPTEPLFNTPTLPPTNTPRPTATLVTPSVTPTVNPVEGTVLTQINVRAEPDKNSVSQGLIKAGEKVMIIGQTAAGDWWQIQYPAAQSGLGWVSSAYIETKSKPEVPVVSETAPPAQGTPAASPTPLAGISAKTVEKVNVRSGPGTGFNPLGMIDPGSSLTLTGKNETGTWLQIFKSGGPGDRGWVSAAYVKVEGDTALLPVFNELGTPVVETGTAQPDQPTPTLVIAPAADDGDSATKPGASIQFAPDGARQFNYSSDVSTPQGDSTDWVQFKPYSPQPGQTLPIFLGLTCEGNGTLNVELWRDGAPLTNWGTLACGSESGALLLSGDSSYLLKLSAAEGTGGLQSVPYTLTVKLGQ
jgi:uncharacterized protein YraI